jgi:hypothetical protein
MQRASIEQLLPSVFQLGASPGSALAAVLDAMETLHAPDESLLGDIDACFDAYRVDDRLLAFLARWVDLDRLLPPAAALMAGPVPFPTGYGRLRDLVATASSLAQQRGTARGLQQFLETATGTAGFEIDDDVPGRAFHIHVTAPASCEPVRDLIERIIDMEKPAYATAELGFRAEE